MVHKIDWAVIGASVGVAVGVFLAALVFFVIRWFKNHSHLRQCANGSVSALPIRTNGQDATSVSSASLSNTITVKILDPSPKKVQLPWWRHHTTNRFPSANGIPKYHYKDIQKATQNFTNILGQGAFGPVYKAAMPADEVVAVKVLASNSKQGEKEFQTEVSLLGRLHHRNLVNLVGYCIEKGQHMLIYEFMSNGSLASFLYDDEQRTLDWEERLQIALDVSHGIEYLHDGAIPSVVHRDLKSANILLDQSIRAKVADFGLSKEENFDNSNSGLKGTYGYIDPAYITSHKVTTKSDIYSFGIILFELITAIHPHQNLMEYINLAAMSSDGIDEILDKRIVGKCSLEEARSLAQIAHKCLHNIPRKRPSISEVSQAILKLKQRRLPKENSNISFAEQDFSRVISRVVQESGDE